MDVGFGVKYNGRKEKQEKVERIAYGDVQLSDRLLSQGKYTESVKIISVKKKGD